MIVSLIWSDNVERAYLSSSKTSQWRDLGLWQQLPPKLVDPWRTDSYCVNGRAYKIAGSDNHPSPHCTRKNIIAFDVVEERLFRIGSPAVPKKERDQGHHSLGESAGHFCYAYCERPRCLLTWMLQKDCSEGECVLRRNVDLQGAPSSLPDDILPFCFRSGGY